VVTASILYICCCSSPSPSPPKAASKPATEKANAAGKKTDAPTQDDTADTSLDAQHTKISPPAHSSGGGGSSTAATRRSRKDGC
jgi:hypothetical protein